VNCAFSLALILAALVSCAAPAADDPVAPPNILFLFADDLRADAICALGNQVASTPNIDRLVASGFVFENNYCMGSRHGAVCAPSRAMLMSGRTLHRVRDDLQGVTTLPAVLGASGYRTFGTGKWHNGQESFERSFDLGWNIMFGGMSDHNAVPLVDLDSELREFVGQRTGSGHSSEVFANAAIDFLEQRSGDAGAPFFCYVAFTAPHDPRDPPEPFRSRAYRNRPPLPPNFRPQHGWNTGPGTLTVRDEQLAAWPRDPEVVRDQLAEYYGLISHLDAQIGRILDALEASGEADRTMIVFTSDHGLALGSHGLLGKQSLYEHSMKAPLVLAGPGVPHASSAALVYLYDLYPTLCAVAGAPLPAGVEGADLLPLMAGGVPPRDSLFTLYRDTQRAVRDERFKLIRFTKTGKTLLYDLAEDPDEVRDLYGAPGSDAVVEELLEKLAAWQACTGDEAALLPAEPLPMTIDLTGHERKPDRWQPQWIVDKYFR